MLNFLSSFNFIFLFFDAYTSNNLILLIINLLFLNLSPFSSYRHYSISIFVIIFIIVCVYIYIFMYVFMYVRRYYSCTSMYTIISKIALVIIEIILIIVFMFYHFHYQLYYYHCLFLSYFLDS